MTLDLSLWLTLCTAILTVECVLVIARTAHRRLWGRYLVWDFQRQSRANLKAYAAKLRTSRAARDADARHRKDVEAIAEQVRGPR